MPVLLPKEAGTSPANTLLRDEKIKFTLVAKMSDAPKLEWETKEKVVYTLLCLRMGGNELHSIFNRVDLISLIIRNLKPKLFLKSHHNLYGIQTIQSKVILEVSIWSNLTNTNAKRITITSISIANIKFQN